MPEAIATVRGPLFEDVCRRKHGGNVHSELANARIDPLKARSRREIYEQIVRAGSRGITIEQICENLGKEKNTVSPRLTELHRKFHLVFDKGTDTKFSVYVAEIYRNGEAVR